MPKNKGEWSKGTAVPWELVCCTPVKSYLKNQHNYVAFLGEWVNPSYRNRLLAESSRPTNAVHRS